MIASSRDLISDINKDKDQNPIVDRAWTGRESIAKRPFLVIGMELRRIACRADPRVVKQALPGQVS